MQTSMRASKRSEQQAKRAAKSEQVATSVVLLARFAHSSLRSQLASLASLDEDEHTRDEPTQLILFLLARCTRRSIENGNLILFALKLFDELGSSNKILAEAVFRILSSVAGSFSEVGVFEKLMLGGNDNVLLAASLGKMFRISKKGERAEGRGGGGGSEENHY